MTTNTSTLVSKFDQVMMAEDPSAINNYLYTLTPSELYTIGTTDTQLGYDLEFVVTSALSPYYFPQNFNNVSPSIAVDNAVLEIDNFMTHVGGHITDTSNIAQALVDACVYYGGSLDPSSTEKTFSAILNNLTEAQFNSVSQAIAVDTSGIHAMTGVVLGTSGNDFIQGSSHALNVSDSVSPVQFLYGGDGNDTLAGGNTFGSVLVGGNGNDVLVANAPYAGTIMVGGAGADTFTLGKVNAAVTIEDFSQKQGDVLDIHNILNITSSNAHNPLNDFVHVTDIGGNAFVSVDANGDGIKSNYVQVAQLDGFSHLTLNSMINHHEIIF